MKSIVLALLLGVLTPALGWAQAGPGLNTITGVTVNGTTVEITGTQKPNFTTFTMTEPPRLVIDISEAVLSGVKDAIAVDNGTITAIQTANYGSEEAAIARVLIIYSREVETDIQARGNSLMVNLSGSAGVAVAARTPTAPGPTPANPPTTGTPASTQATAPAVDTTPGKTAEQATVASREEQKRQEADAEAARQAALAEQKRQTEAVEEAKKAALAEQKRQAQEAEEAKKAALAEQKRQEQAEAEAKKKAQAQAEEERKAQARAEAERKAQEQATKVAAEQAERQRLKEEHEAQLAQAAEEKKRQQEEARVAAEEKKRQVAEEKQQRLADEKARREAAAQAALEARKQQQDEARAAAEEKKRLAAEERERQRAEAQAAAEPKPREEPRSTRVAQLEPPPPAASQGEAAVSGRRKTMTLVGFKQESSGSRVFVRTNEPVRYTVSEANKTVVLELENTRIGDEKNARMLDTSYFDTAVALVDATYAGPSRSTVRVAIKLKQQVPYQTHQEGNVLSIEFGRPTPH